MGRGEELGGVPRVNALESKSPHSVGSTAERGKARQETRLWPFSVPPIQFLNNFPQILPRQAQDENQQPSKPPTPNSLCKFLPPTAALCSAWISPTTPHTEKATRIGPTGSDSTSRGQLPLCKASAQCILGAFNFRWKD